MTDRAFTASIRMQDNLPIIDMAGDINAFADQELQDIYTIAASHSTSTIALNFSAVTYINSTGIALIVNLLAQARKSGKRLAVFGLSDHYKEIFQITRLVDFLTIYPDEASLLAEPQSTL